MDQPDRDGDDTGESDPGHGLSPGAAEFVDRDDMVWRRAIGRRRDHGAPLAVHDLRRQAAGLGLHEEIRERDAPLIGDEGAPR